MIAMMTIDIVMMVFMCDLSTHLFSLSLSLRKTCTELLQEENFPSVLNFMSFVLLFFCFFLLSLKQSKRKKQHSQE